MPASLQTLIFAAERIAEEADAGRAAEAIRRLGDVKKSLADLKGQFSPERLAPIAEEASRIDKALAVPSLYDAAVHADVMSHAISTLTEAYIGELHAGVLHLGVYLRTASRETKRKSVAAALQSLKEAEGLWKTLQAAVAGRQAKDAETMGKQLEAARKHLAEGSLLSARRAIREATEVLARLSSL